MGGAFDSIKGYAHVSDTFTGGFGGGDVETGTTNSTPLIATATFGTGTASYNLHPDGLSATIAGKSATVSFNDWLLYHRESQADAYMQLRAEYTINGPIITNAVAGYLRVNWSGGLMPNADFESQYASLFGTPTVTAWATYDLVFGWPDGQGNLVAPQTTHYGINSTEGVTEFERSSAMPFSVSDDHRIFGFVLTIGGVGTRGGGFNFIGSGFGQKPPPSSTALLASTTSDSLLDTSFFEVVVELPPGLSITADQGSFIRQVTVVPEPAALPAFAAAVAGCYFVRRRARG